MQIDGSNASSINNDDFFVYVKMVNGKLQRFSVKPTDTIYSLKEAIYEITGWYAQQQIAVKNGRRMNDDSTFEQNGIENGDPVTIVFRMGPGG